LHPIIGKSTANKNDRQCRPLRRALRVSCLPPLAVGLDLVNQKSGGSYSARPVQMQCFDEIVIFTVLIIFPKINPA